MRVGDLASAKAIALAPASERARVKSELAVVKANPNNRKRPTHDDDQRQNVHRQAELQRRTQGDPGGNGDGAGRHDVDLVDEIESAPEPAISAGALAGR